MSTVASATAIVSVTLAIEVNSPWGSDCTLQQVKKQATEEALQRIAQLRGSNGRQVGELTDGVRVTEVRSIRIVLNEDRVP